MFVGDTNIYYSADNIEELCSDLNALKEWLQLQKPILNIKKTESMGNGYERQIYYIQGNIVVGIFVGKV